MELANKTKIAFSIIILRKINQSFVRLIKVYYLKKHLTEQCRQINKYLETCHGSLLYVKHTEQLPCICTVEIQQHISRITARCKYSKFL